MRKIRGAWMLAALAGGVAIRSAPAHACSIDSLGPGLNVEFRREPWTIASDGVLALDAYVLDRSPEAGLMQFALELALDGAPVTGSLELVPLWTGTYGYAGGLYEGLPVHQGIVVWRPDAPLAAGEYTGTGYTTYDNGMTAEWPFMLTVTDGPGPALAVPPLALGVSEEVAEVLERACCESPGSSCGDYPHCQPTHVLHRSMLSVGTRLPEVESERAYLWVAPVVGGEVGARVPTHTPYYEGAPWPAFSQYYAPVRFGDQPGEQCLVLGTTSLIDGSSVMTEPQCATLPPDRDELLMPEFKPLDRDEFTGDCLSPPVYEHSGEPYEPYDAGEQATDGGGCRTGGGGASGLVVVALLWVRRRRSPHA
jgi:hypothetical protein